MNYNGTDDCTGDDCQNLISMFGGAVLLCARKLNPKGRDERYIIHKNAEVLYRGETGTFYEIFGRKKGTYGQCEQLLGAFILLSLATGNPHIAAILSKKMLMMNLGGHDFAL